MENQKALTMQLKQFVKDEEIDIFGIADIHAINEKARIGKRPMDLFPTAKSILIFGCGLPDPFIRGWVNNGGGMDYISLSLSELEIRKWKIRRFIRQLGYHSFGGDILGGGIFSTGIRLSNAAESCGLGYIGKNNLLITKKYGPRLNLLYIATDTPFLPDIGKVANECGSCDVCRKACISGAILGDGYYNARQCDSIINCIPNKIHYTKFMNHDCDMCMRMCPKGEIQWTKEDKDGYWWPMVDKYTGRIKGEN